MLLCRSLAFFALLIQGRQRQGRRDRGLQRVQPHVAAQVLALALEAEEPLLKEDRARFSMFPIKDQRVWEMYKKVRDEEAQK